MSIGPEVIILIIFFFWLVGLTFLFVKFYRYYSTLFNSSKKETLVELLNDLLQKHGELKDNISHLSKICDTLEKEGSMHVQKIGLTRFNPFNDTGGDQSFILALLDSHETGVVVSSLHSRTGTRWYAKKVVNGKGLEYDLSSDEEKAVKQAHSLHQK